MALGWGRVFCWQAEMWNKVGLLSSERFPQCSSFPASPSMLPLHIAPRMDGAAGVCVRFMTALSCSSLISHQSRSHIHKPGAPLPFSSMEPAWEGRRCRSPANGWRGGWRLPCTASLLQDSPGPERGFRSDPLPVCSSRACPCH